MLLAGAGADSLNRSRSRSRLDRLHNTSRLVPITLFMFRVTCARVPSVWPAVHVTAIAPLRQPASPANALTPAQPEAVRPAPNAAPPTTGQSASAPRAYKATPRWSASASSARSTPTVKPTKNATLAPASTPVRDRTPAAPTRSARRCATPRPAAVRPASLATPTWSAPRISTTVCQGPAARTPSARTWWAAMIAAVRWGARATRLRVVCAADHWWILAWWPGAGWGPSVGSRGQRPSAHARPTSPMETR